MEPQYDAFASHPLRDEAFKLTSVLTRAITNASHRKTKYLLEKGCDPNKPAGRKGVRPLMVACYVSSSRRRQFIFSSLMKYGADPTLGDAHGRNSIMYACALGLADETELMIRDSDYDLNATDMNGDTPLHVICATGGCTRVLYVLLREMVKHRMDISVQNHEHLSPLSLALLYGNYDCAKVLYRMGGSPRCRDSHIDKMQGIFSSDDVRIAWDDITDGTCQQALDLKGDQATADLSPDEGGSVKFGVALRKEETAPRLFTRVRVESASDICKAHSGVIRSNKVRAKPLCMGVAAGRHLKFRVKGCMKDTAPDGLARMHSVSKEQHPDLRGIRSESSIMEKDHPVSSRPANSMDCINAILSSPVFKTRQSSSFSKPSKTTVHVDTKWLATINTYSVALLKKDHFEDFSLPKMHHTGRQRSLTSSSSSASSSQSQLFRSRVLKHMQTSPHLFKPSSLAQKDRKSPEP